MTASRESESMHRIRCWTPHWQRFDGWSYQTGKPEDTLLAAVSRSLPEAHSHLFHWPHETIWEIQRQVHGSEHCSYRPLLAVTLTVSPLAVRIARYDRQTSEADAILAAKIREWIAHHDEMLADGWTHFGDGCYIAPVLLR
ncbi:hypothetical protein A2348_03775 [Candidatus Uhrbacteria bacterium RIFOXYB12_FULL_58_10]|uniref:Uncharacterized protein n=1 Tax=Candidatus Uhrbacteria bacterium RIFOXYB2_FULL_57_15 TaxID=1802422 RepID=A0A1F7W9F0_9BACT|nr:MAG: hypothetical protein A2348_03775 [Candidatus Uhrbacteria bacterium RIFOXYB12_FULL_58_10]OGL99420.1 MAG: hypothetical protein A2304_01350 [Candidatus Uhrbacteria bacterium RIFOXYB2_FULL_57_15]OGL99863.1 MAG: hypothetical protein A2501_05555 [Candidatus Uhrbacteria bacterium RIFOXYC12_FULL_57_11]